MPENRMRVTTEAPPGRDPGLPSRTRGAALAVLCVTVLLVNLDNTVLNVALPTLVRDLNASSSDLQWIVDAYIIVFAGLMLTAGSLADRVGRKKTFLAGLVIFGHTIVPGSLRVDGSVGDERNALLLVTVKSAGPPFGSMTLTAARLYLFDENDKIKSEQVIFYVVPDYALTPGTG